MQYIVAYLHIDSREVSERVIGVGGSGIVIEHNGFALKIPNLRRPVERIDGERVIGRLTPRPGDYDDRQQLTATFLEEKAIHLRLEGHPGIVRCYDLNSPEPSIQMELMGGGDLRHYLVANRPDQKIQRSWLKDLTSTIAYIHERRIVICDIRSDNILLDQDLRVKITDFGESIMMPLTWNLKGPVDLGWSIATDVGQFGTIIYEVVTGRHCTFDLFLEWKEVEDPLLWPRRESLPSTEGLWLGDIIERCWAPVEESSSFASMTEVAAALEQELA